MSGRIQTIGRDVVKLTITFWVFVVLGADVSIAGRVCDAEHRMAQSNRFTLHPISGSYRQGACDDVKREGDIKIFLVLPFHSFTFHQIDRQDPTELMPALPPKADIERLIRSPDRRGRSGSAGH
jgi:hypothetical protein